MGELLPTRTWASSSASPSRGGYIIREHIMPSINLFTPREALHSPHVPAEQIDAGRVTTTDSEHVDDIKVVD